MGSIGRWWRREGAARDHGRGPLGSGAPSGSDSMDAFLILVVRSGEQPNDRVGAPLSPLVGEGARGEVVGVNCVGVGVSALLECVFSLSLYFLSRGLSRGSARFALRRSVPSQLLYKIYINKKTLSRFYGR
jgi:hypothetical protein